MDFFPLDRLLEKEAYDSAGRRIGMIEAVGMGRGRLPQRVGIRVHANGPGLKFFSLAGARLDDGGVILAVTDPALGELRGGSS